MLKYVSGPREVLASFLRNKGLIKNLIYRDVVGRYKGSMLGIAWSLVNPILMLAVYTFVFSVIFKAKWSAGSDSETEFALVLFAGLLVFNLFSECVTRSPSLILSNVNYVKKVVFPLEILPWVPLGSALFHFAVSLTVWLIGYVIFIGMPNWTIVLVPLIIFPFCMFVVGLSWGLASLGVYLRDVSQIISILVSVLMFLSPIFFPASALPEKFRVIINANPLTYPIEMLRDVMYWGQIPSIEVWLVSFVIDFFICVLGFFWFQKTRKGFSDVL